MGKRRGHGEGSIYQRQDGRWVGEVDLGWVDGKRKRKAVYGRTRAEVARRIRDVQAAVDRGLPVPDDRLTVGVFLDWWAKNALDGTVSVGTQDTYERLIRLYVKPTLGHIRLTRLRPADVSAMQRAMSERGLSASTINGARKVLGRALRRATQEELVARNVASVVDGPPVARTEGRSLTLKDAKILLGAAADDRLEAAYVLLLALGLRRGEVLGLRWDDLDLDGDPARIEICQQLQRHAQTGLHLTELKTAKSRRTLDLPAPVIGVLRAHKARQSSERLRLGEAWGEDRGLVFTTPIGTPLDPDNFRRQITRLTERAGLGKWTSRELRHSAGSLLFAMGVPMKVVSETLGHSSERVTSEVYVHVQADHRAAAARAMAVGLWAN